MGYKQHLHAEMSGEESIIVKDNYQWNKEKNRELERSEIARCNENRDIREKVVSGNPFTTSAGKRHTSELKGSEHGAAQSDSDLHADTTFPSENKVSKAPQAKDTFAGSAKRRQMDESSKKRTGSIDGTKSNKQFNS